MSSKYSHQKAACEMITLCLFFSSPTGHDISFGSFKKTYNTQAYLPITLHRAQNVCFGERQTKVTVSPPGTVLKR